jgi:hypothetical protein
VAPVLRMLIRSQHGGAADLAYETWEVDDGGDVYAYDGKRRICAVSATPTTGPYQGLQANWSYDAFGNRTNQDSSNQPFTNAAGAGACQLAVYLDKIRSARKTAIGNG